MPQLPMICIVDDDVSVLDSFAEMLTLEGFDTQCFNEATALLAFLQKTPNCVVLSDVCMPILDGMQLLAHLQNFDAELPVVLMSGHGDIPMATQAMREGAIDFLEKPVSPSVLIERLKQAQRQRKSVLARREQRLSKDDKAIIERHVVGESPAIKQLHEQILVLANADVDTLIYGETGSGKDVVARALHDASRRRNHPFIAINCGAMPENLIESELFGYEAGAFTGAKQRQMGKIEAASGGTLFLDEIETMPLTAQIRLLRVLQERSLERLGSTQSIPVNIRVIAASKDDLQTTSEKGLFRLDLYYRLNVASLKLPPLRERGDDILMLFEHYCQLAAERFQRACPAIRTHHQETLLHYEWPGNVRELRNSADRFVLGIEGEGFSLSNKAAEMTFATTEKFDQKLEDYERKLIEDSLVTAAGHMGNAAEQLKMSRKTLYRKMKKFQLDKQTFRG